MTLVIAVRGLDISVGAVVAISAAVAALMIGGSLIWPAPRRRRRFPMWLRIHRRARRSARLRLVERRCWSSGVGHAAHRRHADPHGGGPRHRAAHHRRADPHDLLPALSSISATASWPACRSPFVLAALVIVLTHLALTLTRARTVRARDRHQSGGRAHRRRARAADHAARCMDSAGLMAGIAGLLISSNVQQRGRQQRRSAARARRDPRGDARRHRAHRRHASASRAPRIGALIIQTLTSTIYSLGVPPEVNLVVKAALVFVVMLLQSPEFRASVRASSPARPRSMT